MDFESKITQAQAFFDKNEFYFPLLFILVAGLGSVILLNAPISWFGTILFFFVPTFVFLRYGISRGITESTIFAIPLGIAFDSILFRLSLVFSTSVTQGWLFLIGSWFLVGVLCYVFRTKMSKDEGETGFRLTSDAKEETIYRVGFLIITLAAILSFMFIYGKVNPNMLFWGANDANWQVAILSSFDSGVVEMPAFACAGIHGY